MLPAAEFYVAPDGKATGAGARRSPWDIASALGGGQKVGAGDTILLAGGTYKIDRGSDNMACVEVKLAGADDAPVHVRPMAGERVTIDGGLRIVEGSSNLCIWDLEILVSEKRPAAPVPAGSWPEKDADGNKMRPNGGLHFMGGKNCKAIHLTIHDTQQAISAWKEAVDLEVYGCVLYDNGWAGVDRGHGHAIYTQNQTGAKTIANCIFTGGYGYSMHAYGSKAAYVNHYLIEDNIAYLTNGSFLIGGGRPSEDIRVLRNYLYATTLQLGYGADNEDCEVRDNVVVNGTIDIKKFKKVVNEGNVVIEEGKPRPDKVMAVVLPSKYEPNRAHLGVFNLKSGVTTRPASEPIGGPAVPAAVREVDVDVSTFLGVGDEYRLLSPRDVFGKPVASGKCNGKTIPVPVAGEFGCFVLMKTAPTSATQPAARLPVEDHLNPLTSPVNRLFAKH